MSELASAVEQSPSRAASSLAAAKTPSSAAVGISSSLRHVENLRAQRKRGIVSHKRAMRSEASPSAHSLEGAADHQEANHLPPAHAASTPVGDSVLSRMQVLHIPIQECSIAEEAAKPVNQSAFLSAVKSKSRPSSATAYLSRSQQQHTSVVAAMSGHLASAMHVTGNLMAASHSPAAAVESLVDSVRSVLGEKLYRQKAAVSRRHGPGEGPSTTTAYEERATRFNFYREALEQLAKQLRTNLGGILLDIAEEMNSMSELFVSLSTQHASTIESLEQLGRSYNNKVTEERQAVLREVRATLESISHRDVEVHAAQHLAAGLEQQLKALQEQESENAKKVDVQALLIKELTREVGIKRSSLRELQRKCFELYDENQYLRRISIHNADLLREIDERKAAARSQRIAHEEHVKSLQNEIARLKDVSALFEAQQRQLKHTLQQQADEISLLKQCNSEQENLFSHCRRQRDTMMEQCTPRPESTRAVSWLRHLELTVGQGCFAAYSNPRAVHKVPTRAVVDSLYTYAMELQDDLESLQAKSQVQAKIVDFLKDDDLERLQRAGGVSAVPPHSLSVAGLGTHEGIAPHLRFQGLVGIRMMALEEVLVMVDEIRQERKMQRLTIPRDGGGSSSLKPFVDFLNDFLIQRFPSAQTKAEIAYSLDYACSVWRHVPIVELFAKIVAENVPEQIIDEALAFVERVFSALLSALAKHGTPTERRRRIVKRRVVMETLQQTMPWFSEPDFVRLAAVMNQEAVNLETDGVKSMKTMSKDDFPLELMMEPRGGGPVLQFTSPLTSAPSGISLQSPMATAILRAFISAYELYRAEIIGQVDAICRGARRRRTISPSSRNPPSHPNTSGTRISPMFFRAHNSVNFEVAPIHLRAAFQAVDSLQPAEMVSSILSQVFLGDFSQTLEEDETGVLLPFLEFQHRLSQIYFLPARQISTSGDNVVIASISALPAPDAATGGKGDALRKSLAGLRQRPRK